MKVPSPKSAVGKKHPAQTNQAQTTTKALKGTYICKAKISIQASDFLSSLLTYKSRRKGRKHDIIQQFLAKFTLYATFSRIPMTVHYTFDDAGLIFQNSNVSQMQGDQHGNFYVTNAMPNNEETTLGILKLVARNGYHVLRCIERTRESVFKDIVT